MSELMLRRFRLFAILVVASVSAGLLYEQLVPWSQTAPPGHLLFSWSLGSSLVWGFELFVVPGRWGTAIRRLNFFALIVVKSLVLVGILIFTSVAHALVLHDHVDPGFFIRSGFIQTSGFIFLLVFALQAVSQVVRIIGGRVLINFILGKYHHPISEERIFMFLDLVGSTPLAERLGDVGAQSLITRFFFDITEPIIEFNGEIHRYVGDQVVVTWPLRDSTSVIRTIRCYFAIRAKIGKKANEYDRDFGVVPEFRVGVHGGPVVVSECGDYKQEIVYFGDTVNTAARIERQCKAFACPFLISGDLMERVDLPTAFQAESKGFVRLRGRETETEIFTIVPWNVATS